MKNHNLRDCGHSLLCIDSIPLEKYSLALMRWTICNYASTILDPSSCGDLAEGDDSIANILLVSGNDK